MTTNTISQTDVLTAVTQFAIDNKRPCPASYMVEKFGPDVLDVIDALKESGVLLGLRGRNGGLALPGSEVAVKRAEYAAKKAAKAESNVETNEVAVAETSAA
jgi:hypothetical protein